MIILRLIHNTNIEQRKLRGYNAWNYYWRTCCIMCFYRNPRGFARPRCGVEGGHWGWRWQSWASKCTRPVWSRAVSLYRFLNFPFQHQRIFISSSRIRRTVVSGASSAQHRVLERDFSGRICRSHRAGLLHLGFTTRPWWPQKWRRYRSFCAPQLCWTSDISGTQRNSRTILAHDSCRNGATPTMRLVS